MRFTGFTSQITEVARGGRGNAGSRWRTTRELPEGLLYVEDFVSHEEEHSLLSLLEAIEFRPVAMRGQTARRTVRHFGLHYAYESGEVVPTGPLPDAMAWLRERCGALIERDPGDLVQVLVSR